jgi:DNA-directed RNA polymerase subunit alpha
VGELTDYDRLVLELWTDGSITPEKAITEASNLLIQHFEVLIFTETTKEEIESTVVSKDNMEEGLIYDKLNENVLKPIEDLELSVRAYNCLKSAGINLIVELIQKTENELLKTKNFGKRSLDEIKEVLTRQGLKLGMRIDPELIEKLKEKVQRG